MKDFLEFLEEEFKRLTDEMREMRSKTDDDPRYLHKLGRRSEVIIIYAKLLDISYVEAMDKLFDLM